METSANVTVEFCEGRYGGLARLWSSEPLPAGTYLPEVASCASALVILAAGIHLFCYWRVGSGIIRLLAACFIVNGISSFQCHATSDHLWCRIDGASMLLVVYLAIGLVLDQLIAEFLDLAADDRAGNKVCDTACKPACKPACIECCVKNHKRTHRHGGPTQLLCSITVWSMAIIFMLYLFFSESTELDFTLSFGLPLMFMLICGIVLMCMPLSLKQDTGIEPEGGGARSHDHESEIAVNVTYSREFSLKHDVDYQGPKLSRLYPDVVAGCRIRFWVGLVIAGVSALLWKVTEDNCDDYEFFKIFPGHFLWHLGMTIGLINCLAVCALLQGESHRRYPYFAGKEWRHCWGRSWAFCCPVVYTRPDARRPGETDWKRQGQRSGQEDLPRRGDPCEPLLKCLGQLSACFRSCPVTLGRANSTSSLVTTVAPSSSAPPDHRYSA